ncbi:MAG: TIGR03826 family flagellar region protein [Thermotaleaceae bacterium]
MADIRNCKKCGRIYQYDGVNKICARCRKGEDEDFAKVKEYLYDNPKSTITQVSEETGVEEDLILRYLRQGRLEIVGEGGSLVLDCERCGKSIRTGRFCDQCTHEMTAELKSAFKPVEKPQVRDGNKMFTAEMKKKR